MDMHIGLILINYAIGGTEKRFANLFNYLSQNSRHTYYLMLPVGLFGLLCDQGILQENQPGIIKLFQRKPYSIYNSLPFKVFGFRVKGGGRFLGPLWRRELLSPVVRDHFDAFDLVHWASTGASYLYGTLPMNKATVLEVQDATLHSSRSRIIREGLRSSAFFNVASDRIRYACSKGVEDAALERFFVSPCSFIDYTKMFVAPKERIITFIGRLEAIKNPEMFVEAVYRVAQVRKDFTAYILGGGVRERRIDNLIIDRGLQHLLVRQFHPHPQAVLSRSLISVSLQQFDNYHSQALMEAMACGCAIVASDVGETWRLVSDQVGFRMPLEVEAIAERLLFLLDNYDLAVKMGQAAREKVMNEQNVSIYADYLEAVYQRAYDYFIGQSNSE
jgi:glycosyltransferase involved in cell wall biosynthesis